MVAHGEVDIRRRTTSKTVGRYVAPRPAARSPRRRPVSDDHSPRWYGWLIVDRCSASGMLVIMLNYLAGPARLGVVVVPRRRAGRDVRAASTSRRRYK